MGRVWLARDEVLRRDVAVKEVILPEDMSFEERNELCQRTLREARAAGRLSHPNVAAVYDVVQAEGRPWIVMELIRSRSLYQTVKEDGPVSPRRAAEIGLAVLAALRAAHKAGVWHRDVKPGNVLLADDGRVVLTDFGLATFEGDGTVTRAGVILGSAQYISPERARDGAFGPESDMWSLGATLYAAVEGRSPYARETPMGTLTALATAPPDPTRRAGPLRQVLIGLLRKNPRQRMRPAEVERLLARIVAGDTKGRRAGLLSRRPAADPTSGAAVAGSSPVAPSSMDPSEPGSPYLGRDSSEPGSPYVGRDPSWTGSGLGGRLADLGLGDSVDPADLAVDTGLAGSGGIPAQRPSSGLEEVADGELAGVARPRGSAGVRDPHTVTEDTVRHQSVRGRRWPWLVGAIVVVLAMVVPAAAYLQDQKDRAAAVAPGVTVSPAPTPAPAVLTEAMRVQACRDQRPDRETRVVAATAADVVMDDWTTYTDSSGFHLYAPLGWGTSRIGALLCFRDPNSLKTIAVYDHGTLPGDILQLVEDTMTWRDAAGLTGFKRIGVEDQHLLEGGAALEYSYQREGEVKMHGLNYMMRFSGRVFTLYLLTGDSSWSVDRDYLRVSKASFLLAG